MNNVYSNVVEIHNTIAVRPKCHRLLWVHEKQIIKNKHTC